MYCLTLIRKSLFLPIFCLNKGCSVFIQNRRSALITMLLFVFVNTLCFICAYFQRENRDFCIPATVLIRVSVMIAIITCGYHDYALGNRPEFYTFVPCLYFVDNIALMIRMSMILMCLYPARHGEARMLRYALWGSV